MKRFSCVCRRTHCMWPTYAHRQMMTRLTNVRNKRRRRRKKNCSKTGCTSFVRSFVEFNLFYFKSTIAEIPLICDPSSTADERMDEWANEWMASVSVSSKTTTSTMSSSAHRKCCVCVCVPASTDGIINNEMKWNEMCTIDFLWTKTHMYATNVYYSRCSSLMEFIIFSVDIERFVHFISSRGAQAQLLSVRLYSANEKCQQQELLYQQCLASS